MYYFLERKSSTFHLDVLLVDMSTSLPFVRPSKWELVT